MRQRKKLEKSYDDEQKQFTWHRFDMSEYLAASNRNFNTGETGNGSIVDVVFCGITTIEGGEPPGAHLGLPGQLRHERRRHVHSHHHSRAFG